MPTQKKELNVQIGRRIKQAREGCDFTQEKLAELISVSVQYISDLERGKVGASVPTIIKLCNTLNVSSDFLLLGSSSNDTVDLESISHGLSGLSKEQSSIVFESIHLLRRAFATGQSNDSK